MRTKNHNHMKYSSWDTELDRILLSFWAIFSPLTVITTQKNENYEKIKSLEILSFYTCVSQMIIWCMVPEILSTTDKIFCHFGLFFALLPPNNPKNQNFEKMKKIPRGSIILNMSTINENHIMYDSWDTERDRIVSHFGTFFALLHPLPLTTQRIKISKKWKKHLEISLFYKSVP